MKFAFALLAVVGMASAMPVQKSLKNDLDDFLALIPKEKFVELYHKYENDADIQKIVAYLKSDAFAKVVHIVAGVSEVKDLVHYLEDQGIPVIEFLNKLADRLGLPHVPGTYASLPLRSSRSIRQFLDEAIALLPLNDIIGLAMDKLANSVAFQELYMKISEVDYQKLHDAALSHPEIVDLLARVNKMGIDTKKIWETVKSLFGWTYSTRSFYVSTGLQKDLEDYLPLIPKDEIIALNEQYKEDEDVQAIMDYIKSEKFTKLVDIVSKLTQISDLVEYMKGQSVDVKGLWKKLADRLGFEEAPEAKSYQTKRASRTGKEYLENVLKLFPKNDLIALTLDKLANSGPFQNLYLTIFELDYKKLENEANTHSEITDVIKSLKDQGIDTEAIWNSVKNFFGWTY